MMDGSDLSGFAEPVRDVRDRFIELTETHRPALWQYCHRLTGSPWDAEDLVQETLLRAFARLAHFWQPIADARAYLFRIATNTWIDMLRRAAVRPGGAELDDALPDPLALATAESRASTGEAFERLVRLLPPRQRVAVLMADVFDFRNAEVAATLGVTEGAVKALLSRARTTLAQPAEPTLQPDAPMNVRHAPPDQQLIQRFTEAFNRRDMDAMLELLHPDAVADIVGVAEERGREVIRAQSLAECFASPLRQHAEPVMLFGREAIAVYYDQPGEPRRLGWLIRLGLSEGTICEWRSYYFTPELIQRAAAELDVAAAAAGYRYVAG